MYILILNTSILVFANSVADGQEKTNVDVYRSMYCSVSAHKLLAFFAGLGSGDYHAHS